LQCRRWLLTDPQYGRKLEDYARAAAEADSVTVVTQNYDVPAGWLPTTASSKPLLLVNAFAFAKSSTPPPDQWTHFAKLRPVPWKLVAGFVTIAAVCVWGMVATLTQFADDLIPALFPLALMGAGALFFGWATIKSLTSYRTRTGWPHLHGLGLGESGIAYRLTGGDADVPWDAITSIRATFTNELAPSKPGVPVLRVEYAGSKVDLNTDILGVSPLVLYWALLYYWRFPATRDELGTTLAQQRMDGWLAEATSSSVPSVASGP